MSLGLARPRPGGARLLGPVQALSKRRAMLPNPRRNGAPTSAFQKMSGQGPGRQSQGRERLMISRRIKPLSMVKLVWARLGRPLKKPPCPKRPQAEPGQQLGRNSQKGQSARQIFGASPTRWHYLPSLWQEPEKTCSRLAAVWQAAREFFRGMLSACRKELAWFGAPRHTIRALGAWLMSCKPFFPDRGSAAQPGRPAQAWGIPGRRASSLPAGHQLFPGEVFDAP